MSLLGGLLILLAVPLVISYTIADEPRPRQRMRLAGILATVGALVIVIGVISNQ
jgi:hypothetical protein